MKTISLCMIVKNEASHIGNCLESVKDFVDEIIIIDTGSTDQTTEICEQFSATIYQYEWGDDFSAARNFGLQLCQKDWILWLDADETIDSNAKETITSCLQTTDEQIIQLPIINYFGKSEQLNQEDYHLLYQPRLFQNQLGIYFTGRIHETLDVSKLDCKQTVLSTPIHHFGYTDEQMESKKKSQRNLAILFDEIQKNEDNPWIKYFIASELNLLKEYELAFQFLNQSIIDFIKRNIQPPSILYKLKYDILIRTENWQGAAESIEKALLLYPDYVDLHYYKGVILYQLEKFPEAQSAFETCLELGNEHEEYFILHGVGSFRAEKYLQLCKEKNN